MWEAPSYLIKELTRETRRKRLRLRIKKWAVTLVGIGVTTAFVLVLLGNRSIGTWWLHALNLMNVVLGGWASASAHHKGLIESIRKTGDISSVGALAESLWVHQIDQALVTDALKQLLPQMRASDANLLTDQQRIDLYNGLKLKPKEFAEFQIVLLKALEPIGDEAAVPYVERLAAHAAKGEREKSVQLAAIECLPALREQALRRREEMTLLRPAGASDDLLRPAFAGSSESENLLMRPVDGA